MSRMTDEELRIAYVIKEGGYLGALRAVESEARRRAFEEAVEIVRGIAVEGIPNYITEPSEDRIYQGGWIDAFNTIRDAIQRKAQEE